ncbi:cupin domain-containing protein [Halosimplex amylolyticum]|uniref:cupin domain-containing protein n=1 Tax=Halosimplex amylolyticum TaxID=3396616 RepID=UPI003F55ECA1
MTFLERSADTGGEYVLIEIVESQHAQGPPLHIHPKQSETFEIDDGRRNLEVDSEEWIFEEGELATVPPGRPHRYWNGSDEQVRATIELRPAGNFEMVLETTAGLAAVGKVNAAGVPNLLQTAVILQQYWDVFRLVGPPQWRQKPLFAVLAPVGRMLGYRPYYRDAALTGSEPEINE